MFIFSLLKVKTQPCTILRHFEDQQNTSTHALNVKRDKVHFTAPRVTIESMYIVMHFLFKHAVVKSAYRQYTVCALSIKQTIKAVALYFMYNLMNMHVLVQTA